MSDTPISLSSLPPLTHLSTSSPHGSILNIEKLTEGNYSTWKFDMKLALMERGLWKMVDGNQIDYTAELRSADEKAFTQIALCVSPAMKNLLKTATTAREAWLRLEKRFESRSLSRILEIRRKLFTL